MNTEPTERQREVLAAIASYHKQHKVAPSREDLRVMVGVKNAGSISRAMEFLLRHGLVMHTSGVPRSLHLTQAGRRALKGGSNGKA